MRVNDPSQAPAHLPQAFSERIWKPHTHHQPPAFILSLTHTHFNPHAETSVNINRATKILPPWPSVSRHILDTRTHLTGTKNKTHGGTPAALPHLACCICMCTHVQKTLSLTEMPPDKYRGTQKQC